MNKRGRVLVITLALALPCHLSFASGMSRRSIITADTVSSPLKITSGSIELIAPLGFGDGGTNGTNRQAALDNLTLASSATSGYVLASDGTNASFVLNSSSVFTNSDATNVYIADTNDTLVVGTTVSIDAAKLSVLSTRNQRGMVVKKAAGQTVPVVEFQSNDSSILSYISTDGSYISNTTNGSILISGDGGIFTGTGAGNKIAVKAYDVNGAAYTTFMTLTANNSPTLAYTNFPGKWKATVLSPVAATSNGFLDNATTAGTITSIGCIVDPSGSGESVVLGISECDANGDSCAGVDGTTKITCANTWTADDGSLSNSAYDATDVISFDVGTVTGTVSALFIEIRKSETQTVTQ